MGVLSARTANIDEACDIVSRHFYANRIDVLSQDTPVQARLDVVPGEDGVTIGDMSFGVDLRISFGELGAYHVDLPVTGRLAWQQGSGGTRVAIPSAAAVFQPEGDTTLDHWPADCRVIALKIDRPVLERELAELLDSPVSTPIRLAPVLDLSHPGGASWIRLLRLIAADAQRPDGLSGYAVVRRRMRELLVTGLLHAAGHQYRDRLDDPRTVLAAPAAVRRAVEAMRADPERSFTLADLTEVAGVGRRSLQQSFQRYVGITPMAYLRQVRIERAHRDLSQADRGGTTVAQVAQRYGFTHLSRFAADYRARYGVLPSETLRS